jgi:hypothetical protein
MHSTELVSGIHEFFSVDQFPAMTKAGEPPELW